MPENMLDLLRCHPFLKGFTPQCLEKLAAMAAEVRFSNNEFIFREGDDSSFFYLILSGSVALEVTTPGRTLRIQTLGPGEELGWSSVLPGKEKRFQCRSLEPVHALAFDGVRLRRACAEECAFGYNFLSRLPQVVAARLEATRFQLLDVYSPVKKTG